MGLSRFDVLVVGGGPAGSVAALVLARGGVRVALVDKATFPRDKACGDVVGPRGLQLLADLGLALPAGRDVGDMLVVGPTGRRVQLPCADGLTYPGHGTVVRRRSSTPCSMTRRSNRGPRHSSGRAYEPLEEEGRIDGYRLSTGEDIARRLRDWGRRRHEPSRDGSRTGRSELRLVGFRGPHVRATSSRSPCHRFLGVHTLASLSRVRMGISWVGRRGQRGSRDRDEVRPQGWRERGPGTAPVP